MATINGCNIPEDLYYFLDKHVWVKDLGDGTVKVGMTSVAGKLSGGNLTAVTVKKKKMNTEFAQGKGIGMVESSKFVGPIPAPVSGELIGANDKLEDNPNLTISDPYGEGWVALMKPTNWDVEKDGLVTGADAVAKYQEVVKTEGIEC